MFEDKIKQYTANKRTGANLTNIRLGVTPNLTNNLAVATMEELQKLGEKIDKSRMDREIQRLYIEGKKRDLEFERTLADPQIFLNDELYNSKVKELNELKKAKKKEITSSRLLDRETKNTLIDKLELENEKIFNDMNSKRTVNLYKQEVSSLNSELEQLVAIGSGLPSSDIDGRKNIADSMTKTVLNLQNISGLSDNDTALILSQGIMSMEKQSFENSIDDIINSSLNISAKKQRVQEILNTVNDEEGLNILASNYTKSLPFKMSKEDSQKMDSFFKAQIKNAYRDIGEKANKELKTLEYNEYIEKKKQETIKAKQDNMENKIRGYIVKRDTQKLTQLNTGKLYTTYEMVSDNENLNTLYGKTILEFGDINNSAVPKIMNNGDKTELKDLIKNAKEDGLTEQNIANSVIYPYLNQLAGNDEYKLNALIKDFGTEGVKGFDVDTLLNGRKDPEYFNVSKKLNSGKGYELPEEDIKELGGWFSNSKARYNSLVIRLGGDKRAKQALDSYIKGSIINSTDEDISAYSGDVKKEVKEIMPIAFKEFLADDDNYNDIINNLERIRKREIAPIKYRESNIIMENYGIKELDFVDVPLENNDDFELIE